VAKASRAIADAERAQFFDRCYLGDASRNRTSECSGLGFSLSSDIALTDGGNLVPKASAPDVVKLRLTV
jgi:signal transduction histidine kinase